LRAHLVIGRAGPGFGERDHPDARYKSSAAHGRLLEAGFSDRPFDYRSALAPICRGDNLIDSSGLSSVVAGEVRSREEARAACLTTNVSQAIFSARPSQGLYDKQMAITEHLSDEFSQ
jgi:hypothetical protein